MATETKELRCVVCPIGCVLTAEVEKDGRVLRVSGNTCPRGKAYAESELTCPVRTLTTTVLTKNGKLLPVRTSRPISRALLFDAMAQMKSLRISLPVHRGDVLLHGLTEPEIDVIACRDLS